MLKYTAQSFFHRQSVIFGQKTFRLFLFTEFSRMLDLYIMTGNVFSEGQYTTLNFTSMLKTYMFCVRRNHACCTPYTAYYLIHWTAFTVCFLYFSMFIGSVLVYFCSNVLVIWLTKLATCELLCAHDIVVAWLVRHSHVCFHFAGSKLPNDDGEFYQFCYVAASGQVRGASPPFQFKHPMTDDLVEVEDENGELLVIRTKTAVLEDQLKKANETRAELKQVAVQRWSYCIIQLHDLCLTHILSTDID